MIMGYEALYQLLVVLMQFLHLASVLLGWW